ncbi:MAG: sialidase family protein [Bacteroidota bacterium]
MGESKLDLGMEGKILVENQLSAHPHNPDHMLLSGMFIDANNPDDYRGFSSVSRDGGESWTKGHTFDAPLGADPWGIITDKGTAIFTILGIDEKDVLSIYIYRSEDGGGSWSKEVQKLDGSFDHQSLAYDSEREIIYLVAEQANHIYVNYSLDDGRSFAHPQRFLYNNLATNTMTPQLLGDGQLLIPFTNYGRPAINGSRNGGKSESLSKSMSWFVSYEIDKGFGLPGFIGEVCEKGFPVFDVNRSDEFKDHCYYICSSQSDNTIYFHYSDTKATSWAAPIPIKKYHNKARSKRNPFTGIPQVHSNQDGVVGLIWQDRTEDPEGKCNQLYFTASHDGGKSFLPPQKISSDFSCMEKEENLWGGKRYRSGGDYMGLSSNSKGEFIAIWADSRNGISQYYRARIESR